MLQVVALDRRKYIVEYKTFEGNKQDGEVTKYVNKLLTYPEVEKIEVKKWKD